MFDLTIILVLSVAVVACAIGAIRTAGRWRVYQRRRQRGGGARGDGRDGDGGEREDE